MTHHASAAQLGVPRSTLAYWERRWCKDRLAAQPRGRSCHRGDVVARNAAIHWMVVAGPHTGLETLRAAVPTLARGELQDLQRRFRRLWRRNHRRLLRILHWHRPGSVWAMDHTEPPQPIDGHCPQILAVRDLASHYQLAWQPVEHADARQTCGILEDLFRRHGPPLVLKSDNGSAFIDADTGELLRRWQVEPLYSPPRDPQYNGSCEAAGGAMKVRSEHQALLADRPGQWTAGDLKAAQQIANRVHRPWGHRGPTAAVAWAGREPIRAEERAAFRRSVKQQREIVRNELGYPQNEPLGRAAQARVDRLAIGRACVEYGLLSFTRRSISPPIKSQIVTNIS
jgi:transposase InsO family protein